MLKERIQEIFEFAKSESPYRKANKGWINQDIFLDLNSSYDTLKDKKEAAKITLLWSPINILLSNIFLILIIGSILVFTSVSFAKGKFNFNLFNKSLIEDVLKFEDNKVLNTSNFNDLDSMNSSIGINLDENEVDQINTSDDKQINLEQKKITDKIDNHDAQITEIESSQDIKIFEDKKSKSNFI